MTNRELCVGVGLCVSLLALPVSADNRSRVEAFALNDGTFEVIADFTEDALYWCGASVATAGAVSGSGRLYVLEPPRPSRVIAGQTAVRFGLTAPNGATAGAGYSNSVEIIGNSLTWVQARQTCNERSASG